MRLFLVETLPLLCCCIFSGAHAFMPSKTAYQRMRSTSQFASPQLSYGQGRVAIVTGASRGLGRYIAETLATNGVDHVVCVSKTAESCDEVLESISRLGGKASAEECDVSDAEAVKGCVDRIMKRHNRIDILVNNAGITRDSIFMRMSEVDWDAVIKTNLNSIFYFSKAVIRTMAKQNFGRIINLSSVVGIGGNAGQANYAAAKAGVVGLTKSVAKEMAARGITVNAVAPGFIKTEMTRVLPDDVKAKVLGSIPAGRMGEPKEVADLVAFLASDNAGYINGHVIPIDGAMLFGYP